MNLWSVVEAGAELDVTCVSIAYWSHGSDEAVEAWKAEYRRDIACIDAEIPEPLVTRVDLPLSLRVDPANFRRQPHHEWRDAVLRIAGWRYDVDAQCDSCGLYEMDGAVPVCPDCGQCDECGCECGDQ